MLKQLECEIFRKKRIIFHSGLNAVIGDDIASNSIGKSALLMIIDFIFGGEDYINKNHDVVEQLGHHEFKFSFLFDKIEYFFIRNTQEYKYVHVCNSKFGVIKQLSIDEYTAWLQDQYKCNLEDLSFRNIIGRYLRVYGKENLNERKPIQYFEKEKAQASVSALLKLFDKHKTLKAFEDQIKKLKSDKVTLIDAAKKNLIPSVPTKTLYVNNVKRIEMLTEELEALKRDVLTSTTDIEALISKDVLQLRKEKSQLVTQKYIIETRLLRTQTNLKNKNVNMQNELEQFVHYFPDFNVEQVNKVNGFHTTITEILMQELHEAEKELKGSIASLATQLRSIDQDIDSKLLIKDAPKFAIDKVVDLVVQIKQLSDENGYYSKKKSVEESIKTTTSDLGILKEEVLDNLCRQINISMHELNKEIYVDDRRAPTLNIHGNRYVFNTDGDTGTGTAFANLITFDLVLLELTCLPALAHDLPLLKNIENIALENIIKIYCKSQKQIFIAIDKLSSYSDIASTAIKEHEIIELSENKLLFTKNWKKGSL